MSELIGKTLGKYRLDAPLGRGGMAYVYRAYHANLKRDVAVKVLYAHLASQANFLERFQREASAIANLRHPNIVQIYDFEYDQTHDVYYMVMELLEGTTLREEIETRQAQNNPFPRPVAVQIFTALASAVDYAHQQGVVHRDIKPANILFNKAGQVILTDFGLLHLVGEARVTIDGSISGTPAYMSPEQIKGEEVSAQSDIYALGVVLYELLTFHLPFTAQFAHQLMRMHLNEPPTPPSHYVPELSRRVDTAILHALEKDPAQRYQSAVEMAQTLQQAMGFSAEQMLASLNQSGLVSLTSTPFRKGDSVVLRRLRRDEAEECPYRGLYAFQEKDAPFFYGRETYVEQLFQKIQAEPLVAVLGASGSGKSSVVFAGLLPRLRQEGWVLAHFRPGTQPILALTQTLYSLLEKEQPAEKQRDEAARLAQLWESGELSLQEIVKRIRHKNNSALFLLVIDQFEEFYTLYPDPAGRQKLLLELVDLCYSGVCRLVFTLRADFLGRVVEERQLADALQQGALILGPMNREELGRAIMNPAEKQGVMFEEGLVNRILHDVGQEPGNLPLLEFALTALWEQQEEGFLTHVAYETIGRVEGALAKHADRVFDNLSNANQEETRAIFVQLVHPGEGTEDTRRVASYAEIGEEHWPLIQQLATERLIVTNRDPAGQETAEVVHEALIRRWGRLRLWMNDNRTFRAWQERLRLAVRQWQESQEDEGTLLRGAPLAEAQNWLETRPSDIGSAERTFIQSSLTLQQQELNQREKERRARERLRFLLTAVAVVGAVVAFVLSGWALQERNNALELQNIAEQQEQLAINAQATAVAERDLLQVSLSQQLAIQSTIALDGQLDLALLLAVDAYQISPTFEAQGSLLSALATRPALQHYLQGHTSRVQDVLFSPDGQTIATAGADNQIILWSTSSGKIQHTLAGHSSIINSLAFSPDGRVLASGSNDRTILLWDLTSQPPQAKTLTGHKGLVLALAFQPDGVQLASAGNDGQILRWNIADQTLMGESIQAEGGVLRLAYHPNGRVLASAGEAGVVQLWDAQSGAAVESNLPAQESAITALTFVPDGQRLATGNRQNEIQVWAYPSGELLTTLNNHQNWVTDLAFDPAGQRLVSADRDGRVLVWSAESWQPLRLQPAGHTQWVTAVQVSPDGQWLASASYDGTAVVWQLPSAQTLVIPPSFSQALTHHQDWVQDVAVSPDGQWLASAGRGGEVVLWSMATGQVAAEIASGSSVRTVAFSPDSQLLVFGREDSEVTFWDIATQTTVHSEKAHTDFVLGVAFNPTGNLLASAGGEGQIIIWDTTSYQPIGQLAGHEGAVYGVAFADAGQLVSAGRDNTLRVWNVLKLELEQTINHHSLPIRALAISSDRQWVASAGDDKTVVVWNTQTWEVVYTLVGHTAEVQGIAFSPDHHWLASSSTDGTIILWDLSSGRQLGLTTTPLAAHTDWVLGVVFAEDGQFLFSAGRDAQLVKWDLDPAGWQLLACQRANRNLTQAEWQKYFGNQSYRPVCP